MASRAPGFWKVTCLFLASACAAGCGRAYDSSLQPPVAERTVLPLDLAGPAVKKLEPLKAKSFDGVLTGKVVFRGTQPSKRVVVGDNAQCLEAKQSEKFKEDIYNQDWHVGEGKGVMNVVIFLRTPDGMYFPVVEEDKVATDEEAVIDQPFCAFHPQVLVHYPGFLDEEGQMVPTGQKPIIRNSGAILHNANLQNADPKYKNSGFNENIPPGKQKDDFSLNPQPRPLSMACSIHPWMKAHIWVFNHPYSGRTNEEGEFTLRNLPTGVDLQLVCWHPTVGFFAEGEAAGRKVNFSPGENPALEIPISPK